MITPKAHIWTERGYMVVEWSRDATCWTWTCEYGCWGFDCESQQEAETEFWNHICAGMKH